MQNECGTVRQPEPAARATRLLAADNLWAALAERMNLQAKAPAIERAPRDGKLPLSFAQQRLYFLQACQPESAAYNLTFAWRIMGDLDRSALEQTFNALVQRHEIFRTTFRCDEGELTQTVVPARNYSVENIDLRGTCARARDTALQAQIDFQASRPFDLAEWPLMRVFLYQLATHEFVLLVVLHHIIFDGTSLGVFVHDLQRCYDGLSSRKTISLPELPIQYADFAAWQRKWFDTETFRPQLDFWRKQLAGVAQEGVKAHSRRSSDYSGLSLDAKPSQCGRKYFFHFANTVTASVRQFKKQEGATTFLIMLSAFAVLLYRVRGHSNLSIGLVTANRNRPEMRQLIGFFINTLVFQLTVHSRMSFRQLLRAASENFAAISANQDVPFEEIVHAVKPARSCGDTPLFDVMFSFQSLPRRRLELRDLRVDAITIDNGTSKFDLMLDLNETPEGISGFFEYRTDVYDCADVRQMAETLQRLLAQALSSPDTPLLEPGFSAWTRKFPGQMLQAASRAASFALGKVLPRRL